MVTIAISERDILSTSCWASNKALEAMTPPRTTKTSRIMAGELVVDPSNANSNRGSISILSATGVSSSAASVT